MTAGKTITRADSLSEAAAGLVAPFGSENYNSPPRQQLVVKRRRADANRLLLIARRGRSVVSVSGLFPTSGAGCLHRGPWSK